MDKRSGGRPVSQDHGQQPYRRETAVCVDFAYGIVETEIVAELAKAPEAAAAPLRRVLEHLRRHRAVVAPLLEGRQDAA
jgi:hypothetical protein